MWNVVLMLGDWIGGVSGTSWFTGNTTVFDNSNDIFVVGTQESSGSEKDRVNYIKRHLGDVYTLVRYTLALSPWVTRAMLTVTWHPLFLFGFVCRVCCVESICTERN